MIDPNKVIDIVAYNTSIDCSRVVIFVGVLSIHDNVKKIFLKINLEPNKLNVRKILILMS